MPTKPLITAERLREVLEYDPETGIFTARISRGRVKVGNVLGSPGGFKRKYLCIVIDGRHYLCQRLGWFYITGRWPKPEVDHRNRIETDNRFSNLREATKSQSQANKGQTVLNRSGHKGIGWHIRSGKWRAYFKENGRHIHIGTFDILEDAIEARRHIIKERHGAFACHD